MKQPLIRSKQYVTIHSKSNDPTVIRAQLRSELQESWISHRIVSRLELKPDADGSEKMAEFDGTPLRSAGKFVNLYRPSGPRGKPCQHRFYVIRDASSDKFDLLLGADILFAEEKT
jgi:hypothetical protein